MVGTAGGTVPSWCSMVFQICSDMDESAFWHWHLAFGIWHWAFGIWHWAFGIGIGIGIGTGIGTSIGIRLGINDNGTLTLVALSIVDLFMELSQQLVMNQLRVRFSQYSVNQLPARTYTITVFVFLSGSLCFLSFVRSFFVSGFAVWGFFLLSKIHRYRCVLG